MKRTCKNWRVWTREWDDRGPLYIQASVKRRKVGEQNRGPGSTRPEVNTETKEKKVSSEPSDPAASPAIWREKTDRSRRRLPRSTHPRPCDLPDSAASTRAHGPTGQQALGDGSRQGGAVVGFCVCCLLDCISTRDPCAFTTANVWDLGAAIERPLIGRIAVPPAIHTGEEGAPKYPCEAIPC